MSTDAVSSPASHHGLRVALPEVTSDLPPEPDALDVARLLVRARGCERRGDSGGAARHYAQVMALDPAHVRAMLGLANHHMQHQDPHEALALVDQALRLQPQEPALHYTRGNALHQAARPDEALGAYDLAIELGHPLPEVRFAKAGTALMRGDLAQGWAWYEDRPALPALLAPWIRLGLAPLLPGRGLS